MSGAARRLAALGLASVVMAACNLLPSPAPSSDLAGPTVICRGIPEATCHEAIALVNASGLAPEVESAAAIVIADTCPPNAECDREFAIDLAMVIVPADPNEEILALHVFGTMRPEQVAEWQGELPAHVIALLPAR